MSVEKKLDSTETELPTIDQLSSDFNLAVLAKNANNQLYGLVVFSIDNLIIDTNGGISFSSIIIKITIVNSDPIVTDAMNILKYYLPVEKYGMINFVVDAHFQ